MLAALRKAVLYGTRSDLNTVTSIASSGREIVHEGDTHNGSNKGDRVACDQSACQSGARGEGGMCGRLGAPRKFDGI